MQKSKTYWMCLGERAKMFLQHLGKNEKWCARQSGASVSWVSRFINALNSVGYEKGLAIANSVGMEIDEYRVLWTLTEIHNQVPNALEDEDAELLLERWSQKLDEIGMLPPEDRGEAVSRVLTEFRHIQGLTRKQAVVVADAILIRFADLPFVIAKTVYSYGMFLSDLQFKAEAIRALASSFLLEDDWKISGLLTLAELLVENGEYLSGIGTFGELIADYQDLMSPMELGYSKGFLSEASLVRTLEPGTPTPPINPDKMLKDYQEAIEHLGKLPANMRRDWWICRFKAGIGYILFVIKQVEKGKVLMNEAMQGLAKLEQDPNVPLQRLAPSQGLTHMLNGHILLAEGDRKEAKIEADKAQKLLTRTSPGVQPHILAKNTALLRKLDATSLKSFREFVYSPGILQAIVFLPILLTILALLFPGAALADGCH